MEPSRVNTGWEGLTEERRQGDKERRRLSSSQSVSYVIYTGQNLHEITAEEDYSWSYSYYRGKWRDEMSGPLTCFIKKHRMRLGPDLTPRHIVFYPGYDVEDGCRVEDSQTGWDFIPTEEEKKERWGNQNRGPEGLVFNIITWLIAGVISGVSRLPFLRVYLLKMRETSDSVWLFDSWLHSHVMDLYDIW